ncbi:MAG: hypothetical protein ACRD1B_03620 [Thermoanaerobaculia bacterium]
MDAKKADLTGIYLRKGGKTLWIHYRGPRPDESWDLIRQSSGTTNPTAAAKVRAGRVREAKNDRDGIRKFVGSRQRQVTVGRLRHRMETSALARGEAIRSGGQDGHPRDGRGNRPRQLLGQAPLVYNKGLTL